MEIPKSYTEVLRARRYLYQVNPYINSMIHNRVMVAYPRFSLWTSGQDQRATDIYAQEAFQVIDLCRLVSQLGISLQALGEFVTNGRLVLKGSKHGDYWGWDYFIQLDSDKVEMRKTMLDKYVQHFIKPIDPASIDEEMKHRIPAELLAAINSKQLIPLDPTTTSSLQVLANDLDSRGTPPYAWAKAYKKECTGEGEIEFDDTDSKEYKKARSKDRKAMAEWMVMNFFRPLADKNGFKELPKIIWSTPDPDPDVVP